ncbi:RNA polymerase-associated protein LEO1-like isoform X2 [Amphiprion ocellaris]|uniref:RNA polymerase-associated protein LEO1-like isoform X2 n=2 Tax=Amphiprion ocellaris TaxID=80972 RepID=UPI002410BB12|nr:RNA polymerase-associated protein LEO1-like isoform X2 [Amphiprion ocellaris]
MERFKRRLGTLQTHHRKCEERFENAQAKKDHCPSSGEQTPLKRRCGDEPDKACYVPSAPSPSTRDEMLTEESLLSSHSGSDVDYKPSSSPSSREDEVLAQESHSSCYSSPEKHHRHLPSSDTEIGYFTSTFQDGEQLFTTSSSAQRQKKTVTRRRHDEDDDDSDGEVPYSAAARSLVKRQWQTARRHGEDDGGADEDDGSDNTSQVGGMQQDTNRGPQKMTTAKEKHDDDDDDDDSDDDVSDDKTGPGTENTDGVVRQETAGRPLVKQKERTTEKHDDDDRQEPHSTSGSSAVDKPKRIATTRQDDGDDEDSGDSEHDEKDRKRVKRRKKAAHKQKRQQDNDDSDGEDRQTTATGSPRKDQKKTAVTRECSDTDAPEMEVKKQGKRPWNERERTAVKRHLGKFIALQKVPTKQDCLMCIDKESSVLRARRWTDVKYFVYNEIVKIKRKPAF